MKYNYKCIVSKNGKRYYKNVGGKWKRITTKIGEKAEKGKRKYRMKSSFMTELLKKRASEKHEPKAPIRRLKQHSSDVQYKQEATKRRPRKIDRELTDFEREYVKYAEDYGNWLIDRKHRLGKEFGTWLKDENNLGETDEYSEKRREFARNLPVNPGFGFSYGAPNTFSLSVDSDHDRTYVNCPGGVLHAPSVHVGEATNEEGVAEDKEFEKMIGVGWMSLFLDGMEIVANKRKCCLQIRDIENKRLFLNLIQRRGWVAWANQESLEPEKIKNLEEKMEEFKEEFGNKAVDYISHQPLVMKEIGEGRSFEDLQKEYAESIGKTYDEFKKGLDELEKVWSESQNTSSDRAVYIPR